MEAPGDQTVNNAVSKHTRNPVAQARQFVTDWLDHRLGQIDLGNWPNSVKYWLFKIDDDARFGPDCPTAVIGFMAKALACQPGSAWSDGRAASQGIAERDGFSLAEYMGRAPSCSDSFYHTQAVTWFEARLSLVPEGKWPSELLEWAETVTSQLDGAPPALVLGWLGQVLVDPSIPSDLCEPLGNVMSTF